MMTTEQREFAEKNHNLIYSFLYEKNLSIDEYYDIVSIGYCKAVLSYNPSRGTFSTLAYTCMGNTLKEHYRRLSCASAIPASELRSLDSIITANNGDSDNLTLEDKVASEFDTEMEAVSSVLLEDFMKTLSERELTILKFISQGYDQTEIAREMGYTRSYISKLRKGIANKFNKFAQYNIDKKR